MQSTKKAFGYGFLVWLLPFIVAILLSPLKRRADPLFETVMPLVVALCALTFGHLYFRGGQNPCRVETMIVGFVWMSISLGMDSLMFSAGPMKMPFGLYMRDIGLAYLVFPMITIGMGMARQCATAEKHDEGIHS